MMKVSKLPQCKVLKLHLQAIAQGSKRAFMNNMLHLLRKCDGIQKLHVYLVCSPNSSINYITNKILL